MFAKCIVVLAVVAQIRASGCGCGRSFFQNSESNSPVVLVSSGSGSGYGGCSGGVTRNLVGNGKYPVALRNCGPVVNQQIPVTTSRVTAPLQEKPTVRLPASIPAPRTISHSCTCYKTILRPRVHQQIITVPSVQSYVETAHKPVVENIQYEALPVGCEGSGSGLQLVQVGSAPSSGSIQVISGCSSGAQTIQIPQIQTVQIPRVQVVEAVQVPQFQNVQIPQSVSFGISSSQC